MRYWPKEHETKELQVPGGKMFVKTIRETSHAEFVVREFEVTTKTNGKVIKCFVFLFSLFTLLPLLNCLCFVLYQYLVLQDLFFPTIVINIFI